MTVDVDQQAPLEGVILCCTSIMPEQRTELSAAAVEMGAIHKYDLTSDVTHLVVGKVETPKYQYVAKERPDVKVLLPGWIEAVRESWLEGGETNVAALEAQYRVPTFFGLRISITGFNDSTQREQLAEMVTKHGGTYDGNLTQTNTHLVAAVATGKKYAYATRWRVKVVSLEWLEDSILRGMALDESPYDPALPPEERGKGAWKRVLQGSSVLGKRPRESNPIIKLDPNKRKLRRAISAKLGGQNDSIWADIVSGGPSTETAPKNDAWTYQEPDSAASDKGLYDKHAKVEPQRRSDGSVEKDQHTPLDDAQRTFQPKPGNSNGLFGGIAFCIHGFDGGKASILREHLAANGAVVFLSNALPLNFDPERYTQTFTLLPHDLKEDQLPPFSDDIASLPRATNWWVERCLIQKIFINPNEHILFKPLKIIDVLCLKDLVVSSTAFLGIERRHVSDVVKMMGATYDEYLRPNASVLISNTESPNPEKVSFAVEQSIPIVSAEWLWECIEAAEKLPFDDYLINLGERGKSPSSRHYNTRLFTWTYTKDPTPSESLLTQHRRSKLNNRTISEPNRSHKSRVAEKRKSSLDFDQNPSRSISLNKDTLSFSKEQLPTPTDSSAQPLQERPVNIPSPRRPSVTSNTTFNHSSDIQKATSGDHTCTKNNELPESTNGALNNTIAALIAQKQASRPLSAGQNEAVDQGSRRRRRLLGRAISNASNGSSGAGAINRPRLNSTEPILDQDQTKDQESPTSPTSRKPTILEREGSNVFTESIPSQQVIYEDPEQEEARQRILNRLCGGGGSKAEAEQSLRSIGLVRDIAAESEGVGARVGRRRNNRS